MVATTARTPFVVPRLHLVTLAFVLALFGASIVPPSVSDAETGLQVLQVGWNGVVVPGTWTPIKVRVVDPREAGTGRVEIVLNARFQPGPQATPTVYPIAAYAREVPLSTGVTKDLTIWVPAQGPVEGTARLVMGERILAEQPISLPTSQSAAQTAALPVVGVLAESPAVARAVSQIRLSYQGLPVPVPAVSLAAADVPEHAEQLEALSALVVEGNAPADLTDAQRRAIRDWVASGGHLLLLGGPDAANAAAVLPADDQPFTFGDTTADADLGALFRWAGVADNSLKGPVVSLHAQAGEALVNPGDRPLAWRLALGEGTVTALAVDVALDPLASWARTPSVLQKALEPALPSGPEEQKLQAIRRSQEAPGRLQSVVEALPPDVFPDTLTVGLILGGFALLAGPGFAFGFARFNRRGLVWLAVPGSALVLVAGLYIIGVLNGGRDVLENVVGETYLDPLTGQARQTVVAGFYAPTRAELTVQLAGEASVQASTEGSQSYGRFGVITPTAQGIPFAVVSGRDTRVEFPTGRWGMRSVYFTRSFDPSQIGQVVARAQLSGQLIRGTVRNDTAFPLEDAAVVVGASLVKLGNLAPGQTVPFVLDPAAAPSSSQFKGGNVPLSLALFGQKNGDGASEAGYTAAAVPASVVYSSSGAAPIAVPAPAYAPISPGEALTLPQDPEIQRRARLLDVSRLNATNFNPYGPSPAALPLTFLAFTRGPVGPALPSADRAVVRQLTLIDEPLALEVPNGPFTVPAALVPGQILALPTSGGIGNGQFGTLRWQELHGGSVTYDFRLPIPRNAVVDALELTTQQVGNAVPLNANAQLAPPATAKPTPAEAGVFAVYNWQTAGWDALPAGQEQSRVPNAARYLGPEGHVRVRVSAPANRTLRFVPPQLAVDGRGGA